MKQRVLILGKFFFYKILPSLVLFSILLGIFVFITKDGPKSTEKYIKAQIIGAVKTPGVYEMKSGSIVKDLIDKAGGFDDKADSQNLAKINQAKKLQDGESIFVAFKSESVLGITITVLQSGKININKADAKLLDSLPGVGEVTAKKIIQNRPYTKISDLLSKKVVSSSVYKKIEAQIEI